MTRLRIGVLLAAGLVVAAASGGVVGAGAAIALVKTAYNGRIEGASRAALAVHSVLVGHSLGGLFTLYALVERPALFDGYFAFSPCVWVGDQAIVPDFVRLGQSRGWPRAALYLSLGSHEGIAC